MGMYRVSFVTPTTNFTYVEADSGADAIAKVRSGNYRLDVDSEVGAIDEDSWRSERVSTEHVRAARGWAER